MKYVIYRGEDGTEIATLIDRKDPDLPVFPQPMATGYVSFDIVCGDINPRCYPIPEFKDLCRGEYDAAIVLESMTRR